MSFLSILQVVEKDVFKVLGVVTTVDKFVLPFLGPVGVAIETVFNNSVNLVEAAITTAQQQVAKKATAGTIVASEIPTLEAIVAEFGPNVKLSDKAVAAIGAGTDAAVALKNSIATIIAELEAARTVPAPIKP